MKIEIEIYETEFLSEKTHKAIIIAVILIENILDLAGLSYHTTMPVKERENENKNT